MELGVVSASLTVEMTLLIALLSAVGNTHQALAESHTGDRNGRDMSKDAL